VLYSWRTFLWVLEQVRRTIPVFTDFKMMMCRSLLAVNGEAMTNNEDTQDD